MRIKMQKEDSENSLTFSSIDVAIVGKELDDRGQAAINFLRSKTGELISIDYDPDNFELENNEGKINAEDIENYLRKFQGKAIILEATTLGFVEIFLCCRALYDLGFSGVSLLYVEPFQYQNPRRTQLLHKRDFELSQEVSGYRAIPGATFMLTDRRPQKGVFFLGYEERRLDSALEDYQMIQPTLCSVVFGVPAFKPGWEMDAFANNIRVIRDKNIRGGVLFCGAENPAATVDLLTDIHNGLKQNEAMFVAPIGTKPHGIGVALFVAANRSVGVLYDHPIRKHGRSSKVTKWHLFQVEFESNRA